MLKLPFGIHSFPEMFGESVRPIVLLYGHKSLLMDTEEMSHFLDYVRQRGLQIYYNMEVIVWVGHE